MAEPNTTIASTGAALVTVTTVVIGPVLGEYAIIIGLGFLGTLVALSEVIQMSIFKSLVFVLRGVVFSFVFTGLITLLIVKYIIPGDLNLPTYAVLGIVAFTIGWTSNRWSSIKDWAVDKVVSKYLKKPLDEEK